MSKPATCDAPLTLQHGHHFSQDIEESHVGLSLSGWET
jgi:hypothetical protein